MDKKKIIGKNKKPDWKFIVLLLGILLVGLSVFVLNQKVTYKSSAQWNPNPLAQCATQARQCRAACTNSSECISTFNNECNKWAKVSKADCKSRCNEAEKICRESVRNQQTQPGTNNNTGTTPFGVTTNMCNNFSLAACQSRCQNSPQCQALCQQINNACAQN